MLIPTQFARGCNVNINIHKRFPRAAGYKLQAAGHRRQAASYRQQATGEGHQGRWAFQATSQGPQAAGYKLQVASYRLQASCVGSALGPFLYDGGLSESGDFPLHLLVK